MSDGINKRRASQNRLYGIWLKQLHLDLMGVGRGYSVLDWDIHMKGMFIRGLLMKQDPEGYTPFFEDADKLVAEAHSKNWAKRIFLDELKVEDLTEENMSIYLGQVEYHALFEHEVMLRTPTDLRGVYEKLVQELVQA